MLKCIVLLFVVQFEFEFSGFGFELNVFEPFSENTKPFSVSLTRFQPHPIPLLFFFFFPAAHISSAGPFLFLLFRPNPPSFPFPFPHRRMGPARQGLFLPVLGQDSAESDPAWRTPLRRLGPAHRGPVLAPIKAPRPLPESPRACAAASARNPSRAVAIGAAELGLDADPPLRRLSLTSSTPRSSAR